MNLQVFIFIVFFEMTAYAIANIRISVQNHLEGETEGAVVQPFLNEIDRY
jgi:hypothetical protein